MNDSPAEAIGDRRPLKSRSLAWVQALARALIARRITANQISVAGIGFALLGFGWMMAVWRGWMLSWLWLLLAAACVQARLLCNLLDGLVAVEGGLKAKGGELFNEIPDRIEDTLLLVGAGYASGHVQLGWFCAVLAVFTAYVRAFGASLGQGQDFGGPCAKPQRMFLLTVGLLAAIVVHLCGWSWNVLGSMLWVIAAGTALTAILRLSRIYQKAR